jgi:hypothetical protein
MGDDGAPRIDEDLSQSRRELAKKRRKNQSLLRHHPPWVSSWLRGCFFGQRRTKGFLVGRAARRLLLDGPRHRGDFWLQKGSEVMGLLIGRRDSVPESNPKSSVQALVNAHIAFR